MQSRVVYFQKFDSPLMQYRSNIHSQSGEDGLLAHIIGVIQPAEKYCVEFGAWDGVHFSNCNALVTTAGWGGLMIEGNPDRFKQLVATFAAYPQVTPLNQFVEFEGDNTLDGILTRQGAPQSPGVLSIDIDGNDYHIWESLKGFTPEIVVIEINPTIPNDVYFIQDKSPSVNHGCSLLAAILLGKQKGYELAVVTTFNAFFVRNDKFGLLGIADNSIHKLYQPPQNGRIFQGMDGTIHVVGMDHLVWRQQPLTFEDFQVLPPEDRVYGDAQR